MKQYRLKQGGHAVRYHELPGDHPPVVFLHGLGCASSFEYPCVMAQPALRNRRALLIDLLGAGYSDRPIDFDYSVESHAAYLSEMIEALDLPPFVLFGHSLGGAVAICLATLQKERIKSLVLTESNLDPSESRAVSRKIGSQSREDFLCQGYNALLASARKKNPLWGATLAHWLPEAAYGISCSAMRGGTPSWRQQLYALHMPRTFLFGERSLPSEDVEALPRHGVHVGIIPNAGHSMGLENPAALAEAIARAANDQKER